MRVDGIHAIAGSLVEGEKTLRADMKAFGCGAFGAFSAGLSPSAAFGAPSAALAAPLQTSSSPSVPVYLLPSFALAPLGLLPLSDLT